jgi:hypothetical protein
MSNSRGLRSLLLSVAITSAMLCAGSATSWAQITQISITVDENGKGTINGFLSLQSLPSSVIADPGPGGKSNVLAYDLLNPPGLVLGDVILRESVDSRSDLIRFDPNVTFISGNVIDAGALFFYSDLDGPVPVDALADIGLPGGLNTNVVTINEVSLGALGNGAVYTPTSGQPGFVAGAPVPIVYTFISDGAAAPEPGSFLLVLPAAALVAMYRRRKQNARRDTVSV